MTYDFNQLFAGFQLPGTDKFQALFADAGERSQELAAKSQKAAEELPSSPRPMSKRSSKPAASPPAAPRRSART
jgi:hypothetical protein